MKKFTFGMLAAFAMTGSAVAADMAPRYAKAPPVPVAIYSWSGCYIGGNIGGGWERTSQTRIGQLSPAGAFTAFPDTNYGSSDGSDFVGGGQIGCDYQFANNWVIGIQGMYDYARIDSSHILPAFPTFTSNVRVKDIYTVTGRVGYLFTPQLLGYVKGGGAWTSVDYVINGNGPPVFNSENAFGVNRSGWTVGGGLEWMFAPGWSVFGEFNYMDFGTKTSNFTLGTGAAPGSSTDVVRSKLEVEQFLVGVNYKFNFGGPVVARY
ncbi:MAG: outer membrane beta-barrel protein [Xanthobacteraceae bacterium]|nr:outer membrane beta-barrel protein [Xanthobacteraceae bacterium]